jgi:hypothetical protein
MTPMRFEGTRKPQGTWEAAHAPLPAELGGQIDVVVPVGLGYPDVVAQAKSQYHFTAGQPVQVQDDEVGWFLNHPISNFTQTSATWMPDSRQVEQ